MHSYVEQLERLMTVVILVLLGGAIARGLLAGIGWAEVLVALAFLLLVRPLSGWLALAGARPARGNGLRFRFSASAASARCTTSASPSARETSPRRRRSWALVGLVVAMSIVLHGATTAPVMNRLDRLRQRRALEQHGDEGEAPRTAV